MTTSDATSVRSTPSPDPRSAREAHGKAVTPLADTGAGPTPSKQRVNSSSGSKSYDKLTRRAAKMVARSMLDRGSAKKRFDSADWSMEIQREAARAGFDFTLLDDENDNSDKSDNKTSV
jgi:hypothetical protein